MKPIKAEPVQMKPIIQSDLQSQGDTSDYVHSTSIYDIMALHMWMPEYVKCLLGSGELSQAHFIRQDTLGQVHTYDRDNAVYMQYERVPD